MYRNENGPTKLFGFFLCSIIENDHHHCEARYFLLFFFFASSQYISIGRVEIYFWFRFVLFFFRFSFSLPFNPYNILSFLAYQFRDCHKITTSSNYYWFDNDVEHLILDLLVCHWNKMKIMGNKTTRLTCQFQLILIFDIQIEFVYPIHTWLDILTFTYKQKNQTTIWYKHQLEDH